MTDSEISIWRARIQDRNPPITWEEAEDMINEVLRYRDHAHKSEEGMRRLSDGMELLGEYRENRRIRQHLSDLLLEAKEPVLIQFIQDLLQDLSGHWGP